VSHLTYLQAVLIGLLQGVSELFPVSSLGHSIIIPALIGGDWARNLNMTADKSPYLSFVVAVHVATAMALIVFYRRDWARIISGLLSSIRNRSISTSAERLAWLLIAATIPVGVVGLAFEHVIRTTLGRPWVAALFLTLNGVLLYAVEKLRNRGTTGSHRKGVPAAITTTTPAHEHLEEDITDDDSLTAVSVPATVAATTVAHGDAGGDVDADAAADDRLGRRGWGESIGIGAAQILALLPGISRSGATIAAGLVRGLDHEDSARFAFLLATPVILAAGLLKLPELAGPEGNGILGQVFVGSLVAGVAAYLSLRFLTRYFHTHTLTPFAIYCTLAGLFSLAWLTLT
jgi:undecaprenyl-diphosphatase